MIQVSHSELLATLQNAFKAMGFRPGESLEAAETVAWLERHGLAGIAEMGKAFEYMAHEAQGCLEECYHSNGLRVFSAGGNSILSSGSLAVDTALSMAQRHAFATVRIEECHNRALVTGFLMHASEYNTGMLACWSNQHQSRLHSVWYDGVGEFPYLRTQSLPSTNHADQSLTLIASRSSSLWPNFASELKFDSSIRTVDPKAMKQAREQAMTNGLMMPDQTWKRLKSLASGILVDDQLD